MSISWASLTLAETSMLTDTRDVNVVWLTYHQSQPAYMYHDQGLLHNLFMRRLWMPANPSTFIYRMGWNELPDDAEGAVVVFPARFNTEPRHLTELNADLAKLKWVVLIITSDEESSFDWQNVKHPNMKLWVSTPKSNQGGADLYFGDGYRTEAPDILRYYRKQALTRPLDWFFAGQRTTNRRNQCADAIQGRTDGYSFMTQEFASGLEYPDYLKHMASAKAALCPSGAVSQDTFRFYEALEAGAVPIADTVAVNPETNPGRYWEKLYGENPPFKLIDNWSDLSSVLKEITDTYPVTNNRVFAWWQNYKRNLAYTLEDHIRHVSEKVYPQVSLQDKITVLVPTSPIPSHPSTEIIEETILSIKTQLNHVEIILLIDGVRAEQGDKADAYNQYIQKLLWLSNNYWKNTVPLLFDSHTHQANMTKKALDLVKTNQILFVEHDTPLIGQIDWLGITKAIDDAETNMVRFHYDPEVHEEHTYLMKGSFTSKSGVPLIRSTQWSQRPHIANAHWYRGLLAKHFNDNSRTMIEDAMHGPVAESPWDKYKLTTYNPPFNMKRSYHLDARGDDTKYEMEY